MNSISTKGGDLHENEEAKKEAVNYSAALTTETSPRLPRIATWFSCGAASAVAAKQAIDRYSGSREVVVVCCDTRASEHDDNYRFSAEVEAWLGQPIIYIINDKYGTVDDVFKRERYMSGPRGARCTVELKKIPRFGFQRADDVHVFGFTFDERKRVRSFTMRNPELSLKWILVETATTKADCYDIVARAGIALPVMYGLGFDNNNCPGCVKASSPWYWDMIRTHFPKVFKRRCVQSRALGVRLVEIKHHVRIFLDELPPGPFKKRRKKERMSCGPDCVPIELSTLTPK